MICICITSSLFIADFDRQSWYASLLDFGSSAEAVSTSEEEEDLIPKLVANLVFPLANHAVQVRMCKTLPVSEDKPKRYNVCRLSKIFLMACLQWYKQYDVKLPSILTSNTSYTQQSRIAGVT